jgi:hypothetical protein
MTTSAASAALLTPSASARRPPVTDFRARVLAGPLTFMSR